MSATLQFRFPAGASEPLLWTIAAGADQCWLLLAYRHIVADAYGVQLLIARVLMHLAPPTANQSWRPLSLSSTGEIAPKPRRRSTYSRVRGFVRGLRLYFQFRFVHKMPDERTIGDETTTTWRSAPIGLLGRLQDKARASNAGLNDLFIAAVAVAIAELTPDRCISRHRRKLAIGTIVSMRRGSSEPDDFFGVSLGDALALIHRPDDNFDAVLEQVARCMRPLRRDRNAAASLSDMGGFFVNYVWPIFDVPNHRRSYRKILPICGSVSSVRINEGAFGPAADRIAGYVRACPLGPITPVVLAPTMWRDQLELTLTCRVATYARQKAEALLDRALAVLEEWAGDGMDTEASPPLEQGAARY
jgi:hypothetical protein